MFWRLRITVQQRVLVCLILVLGLATLGCSASDSGADALGTAQQQQHEPDSAPALCQLWGAGNPGATQRMLVNIDPSDATSTAISGMQWPVRRVGMALNPDDHQIYFAGFSDRSTNDARLYRVNLTTGEATLVQSFTSVVDRSGDPLDADDVDDHFLPGQAPSHTAGLNGPTGFEFLADGTPILVSWGRVYELDIPSGNAVYLGRAVQANGQPYAQSLGLTRGPSGLLYMSTHRVVDVGPFDLVTIDPRAPLLPPAGDQEVRLPTTLVQANSQNVSALTFDANGELFGSRGANLYSFGVLGDAAFGTATLRGRMDFGTGGLAFGGPAGGGSCLAPICEGCQEPLEAPEDLCTAGCTSIAPTSGVVRIGAGEKVCAPAGATYDVNLRFDGDGEFASCGEVVTSLYPRIVSGGTWSNAGQVTARNLSVTNNFQLKNYGTFSVRSLGVTRGGDE